MREEYLRTELKKNIIAIGITGISLSTPLIFLAITIVLGLVQPYYDPMHDTISSLVWGVGGWLQTGMFYLFGIFLLILPFRLFFALDRNLSLRLGLVLVGFIGITFIVIGVCPTRAPDAVVTRPARIHELITCALAVLFTMANYCISLGLKSHPGYRKTRNLSLIAGTVSLALNALEALMIIFDRTYLGLLERLMLINGMAWVEIIGYETLLRRQLQLSSDIVWIYGLKREPSQTSPSWQQRDNTGCRFQQGA